MGKDGVWGGKGEGMMMLMIGNGVIGVMDDT